MADSLREALSAALENAEPMEKAAAEPVDTASLDSAETSSEKADRLRDEGGRFAKDASAALDAKTVQQPLKDAGKQPQLPTGLPAAAVEPRKPPASWKKDYWEAYAALPEPVAKYIGEREEQFQSGVSTYKQEAERAKGLWDAIAPFQEDLNRFNIQPDQWIRQLGGAHQMLAKGTPEQKLQMFQKLAQDYNVPLHAVQTGQVDPIQQYLSPLQEQVAQLKGQLTQFQEQGQKQEQAKMQADIQSFAASHEHYEAVRSQMAGLLQSGMADDLQSAYDKALRLNDELWQSEQQRKANETADAQRKAQQDRVNKARQNSVSPRSDTPSGSMVGDGKKGLRAQLEDAVEAVAGGRV